MGAFARTAVTVAALGCILVFLEHQLPILERRA